MQITNAIFIQNAVFFKKKNIKILNLQISNYLKFLIKYFFYFFYFYSLCIFVDTAFWLKPTFPTQTVRLVFIFFKNYFENSFGITIYFIFLRGKKNSKCDS